MSKIETESPNDISSVIKTPENCGECGVGGLTCSARLVFKFHPEYDLPEARKELCNPALDPTIRFVMSWRLLTQEDLPKAPFKPSFAVIHEGDDKPRYLTPEEFKLRAQPFKLL